MQGEGFLGLCVAEDRRMDVLHILRQARPATVVVHHYLQIIRCLPQLLVILLGAEEGAERVVMPDVPTDLNLIVDAFGRAVDFILAVGPSFLPGKDFRIVKQQAPERDEVTIARSLVSPRGAHKLIQLDQALTRPFDRDATLAPPGATVFAEAGERRAAIESTVARADRVVERSLSLRSPQNPINLVGLDVVLDQRVE